MNLDVLPIGKYEENSYVLHDNGHVVFVDPGRHADYIRKYVNDEMVDAILLTHGHEDHTGAADDLAEFYHCPLYISVKDRELTDPSGSVSYGAPVDTPMQYYDRFVQTEGFRFRIYETPGHTEGSVCIRYKNILFTGDTLFAGSIGRTDLGSGNEAEMVHSLDFLKTLPVDLQVFPGHGPASTIGHEIATNIFMKEL